MLKPEDILRALAAARGDAICVPTMTTAPAWRTLAPDDLSVTCVGFMGGASSLGLGLALARPDRRVIVFDGDGSLLMQLGSLATIAGAQARNLTHLVFKNGVYHTSGAQGIPGGLTVDFVLMAKGAGYKNAYAIRQPAEFKRRVPRLGATPLALAITGPAVPAKRYRLGTREFRYWAAAEALRRGADFWGALLPRSTRWQPGRTLRVTLDAGVDLNAYYDRRGLSFFHDTVGRTTVYSGESPDVVCHELGHAVLDALRPELWDAMSVEVAAFHESFGDLSALLAGLQLPSLRRAVLSETGARIGRSSRLSRLADQLGWALRQILPGSTEPDCLRNAVNPFFYRAPETLPPSGPSSSLTAEPHSFSRVFTGGWFEALAGMLAVRASSPTEADLLQVSLDAGRLLVDAIPAAPIVADYGSQVAAHLIESDAELFRGRYRDALKSALVRRGILSLQTASIVTGPGPGAKARRARRTAPAAGESHTRRLSLSADEFGFEGRALFVEAPGA